MVQAYSRRGPGAYRTPSPVPTFGSCSRRVAPSLSLSSAASRTARTAPRHVRRAVIDGVHVYKGQPGAAAGHAVEAASYFDRFWEHGSHRERWYLVLKREFTG